jgi:hypothetical protein
VREFLASAHGRRLEEFPPWQRWRDKEGRRLSEVTDQVTAALGVAWSDVWEKVLGHELLLAIWPAERTDTPAGEKSEESHPPAVVIVRAADAAALRRVAEGFRTAQKAFEGVAWSTASHDGIRYELGARPSPKPPLHLAILDTVAVLSEHEGAFHRILELSRRTDNAERGEQTATPRLSELPAYLAAAKHRPDSAVAVCFINPRPWEAVVRAGAAAAPPESRAEKQMLLETWQAVEYGWASLELTPRVRWQAVLKFDGQRLPGPISEFLACFRGASGLLSKIPADSLFAAAGRIDVDRFITWARKHAATDDTRPGAKGGPGAGPRQADVLAELLRLLGPDLGFYVKLEEAGDGDRWLQWAGAVGVRPEMPREKETQDLVRAAVPALLRGVAGMFSESGSSRLAGLLTGQGLRTLGDSLRVSRSAIPAVTVAGGQLWAAGTERTLASSQTTRPDSSLAKSPRLTRHLTGVVREPSHLLYVDCAGWESLITRQADALIAATVQQRGVDEMTARRGLQQLKSLLRLADTFVMAVKIDDGQIAVSLSASVEPTSAASSSPSALPTGGSVTGP